MTKLEGPIKKGIQKFNFYYVSTVRWYCYRNSGSGPNKTLGPLCFDIVHQSDNNQTQGCLIGAFSVDIKS